MAIITITSPRRGAGKSTTAALLACALAHEGPVVLVDAGADGTLAAWSRVAPPIAGLEVIRCAGKDAVVDDIQNAANSARHVVIDLDGMMVPSSGAVLAASDLVLVPTRERFDDVAAAPGAAKAIEQASAAAGREIPCALVISRRRQLSDGHAARQIATKLHGMEGVRLLDAVLDEREVFANMLSTCSDPRALLDREREIDAEAMEAVDALMREVLSLLEGVVPRKAAPTPATSRPTLPQRDETVVQFSVRGPKWIADQFRALCKADRRTHSDMLRVLMEAYRSGASDG